MSYIEIRGLKKRFGDNVVLDGIDLDIEKGEVVAVIGPSGTGKSTLLRCATLLETMDGGDLIYLFVEISVLIDLPDKPYHTVVFNSIFCRTGSAETVFCQAPFNRDTDRSIIFSVKDQGRG